MEKKSTLEIVTRFLRLGIFSFTYLRIWRWRSTTRTRRCSPSWRTSAGRNVANPRSSRPYPPRYSCPSCKADYWRILCCPSARRTSSPFEASSPRWSRPWAERSDPPASARRSLAISSRIRRSIGPWGSWSRLCAWTCNHWCPLPPRADSTNFNNSQFPAFWW